MAGTKGHPGGKTFDPVAVATWEHHPAWKGQRPPRETSAGPGPTLARAPGLQGCMDPSVAKSSRASVAVGIKHLGPRVRDQVCHPGDDLYFRVTQETPTRRLAGEWGLLYGIL